MKLTTANMARIVFLIILIAIPILYFLTPVGDAVNQDSIEMFISMFGPWAPLVFIVIYIVAVLFFLPASLFSLLGGILFGTLWGTVYVLIAATTAAALGFLFVRRFFAGDADKINQQQIQAIVKKIEKGSQGRGFQVIFILRLLYLPYMALTYAAALVKNIPFWSFVLATFLTNIVGSFTFVFLGDQLDQGWKALIVPIILIVLTLLIPKITKMFLKKSKLKGVGE